jgi:hypothetical protein
MQHTANAGLSEMLRNTRDCAPKTRTPADNGSAPPTAHPLPSMMLFAPRTTANATRTTNANRKR